MVPSCPEMNLFKKVGRSHPQKKNLPQKKNDSSRLSLFSGAFGAPRSLKMAPGKKV